LIIVYVVAPLAFTQRPTVPVWWVVVYGVGVGVAGIVGDLAISLLNRAVGGSEFLDELLDAHAEYGRALNITSPKGVEATVNLTDALRDLRTAILGYSLQVVAWSQSGDAAAAACAGALLAIDRERASDAQRQSGKDVPEPDVSPETPVPQV
jgi:hypothetical protein